MEGVKDDRALRKRGMRVGKCEVLMSASRAMDIPTLDLEDVDGSPEARARAAEALRVGFGTYGLIYIRNHAVDRDAVAELYDHYERFCGRSEADKAPLNRGDIWYQRGWTPPNTEQAVVAGGQPDFKECYFAAPEAVDPECAAEYPEIHADNVWPADLPGFEARYLEVGRQLHRAGSTVLRACARALELEEDVFTTAVDGGPHVFRLLRYLPLEAAQIEAGVVWGEEHTDFNLLTLLPGGQFRSPDGGPCDRPDDESGLYLRTRPTEEAPRGVKVRGRAPEGCIVAQVGQQLEVLTGGTFLATPHVITAPKTPGFSRMSAAHFVHLQSHQRVFPLPAFRNEATVATYRPPVLAGNYSLKTLVDIGLAPKAAIEGLGYKQYGRLAAIRAAES